jgi:hypothetical protein
MYFPIPKCINSAKKEFIVQIVINFLKFPNRNPFRHKYSQLSSFLPLLKHLPSDLIKDSIVDLKTPNRPSESQSLDQSSLSTTTSKRTGRNWRTRSHTPKSHRVSSKHKEEPPWHWEYMWSCHSCQSSAGMAICTACCPECGHQRCSYCSTEPIKIYNRR